MIELEQMRYVGWTYREIASEANMTVKDLKACFIQAEIEEKHGHGRN